MANFLEAFSFSVILFGSVPMALVGVRQATLSSEVEARFSKLLGFLIWWCFLETTQSLILGTFGIFQLNIAVICHAALFLVGMILLNPKKILAHEKSQNVTARDFTKTSWTIILLFLISCIFQLWNGMIWPTVEVDSLSYHLPLIAQMIQSGKISFLNHFWFQEHFPRNWEMLCALYALPTRNDTYLLFPNLIARCIFGLSIACICLRVGVSTSRALAAAAFVVYAPLIVTHMETMNVDLPFAAFVLAAIYFAFTFSISHSWAHLALALISISMFLGIKSTGIMYVLICMTILSVGVFTKFKWSQLKPQFKSRLIQKIGVGALLLSPGFFWYFYNLILFGNPLVGVDITFLGLHLFSGMYTISGLSHSSLIHVFDPFRLTDLSVLWEQVYTKLSYGFFMVLVFTLTFIILSAIRSKEFLRSRDKPLLLLLTVLTFFIYVRTPFSGNYNASMTGLTAFVGQAFRLGFPFLGLVAVLGALGMERLKINDRIVFSLILPLFLFSSMGQWKMMILGLMAATIILIMNFAFLSRVSQFIQDNKKGLCLGFAISFPLFFIFVTPYADKIRAQNLMKRSYGPTVTFVNQTLLDYERIGFTNSDQSYAFFGSDFSHEVFCVQYQDSNFTGWIKSLKEKKIQVVAIGPSAPAEATAEIRNKIDAAPEIFKHIFSNSPIDNTTLYRIME